MRLVSRHIRPCALYPSGASATNGTRRSFAEWVLSPYCAEESPDAGSLSAADAPSALVVRQPIGTNL